jgi:hypothetical protein
MSHRCPECGFLYDQETAVWRPARPWKGYGGVLAVNFAVVIGSSLNVWRRWSGGAPPTVWDVLILVVALMCVLYLTLHIRATHRKGRCVVVSTTGVFVRNAHIERLVPWDEIVAVERVHQRVKEERDEYIVGIKTRSSSYAAEVDKIFSSEAERTSFMEAVQARLQDPRRSQQDSSLRSE